MKQKFLYLCFLLLLSGMFCKAYSQTVEVVSLSSFSTENPPAEIKIQLSEPIELSNNVTLPAGTKLNGNLIDVVSPKRLKRDATFSFNPTSYIDGNGKVCKIKQHIIASYAEPVDKGGLAKSTALGVGNYFVKGLSIGVAAVEGAVKNTEDNRLKSSVVSAYESSPLSYVEKGEELEIIQEQHFFLKFPNIKKSKKRQNYEYTIEKE